MNVFCNAFSAQSTLLSLPSGFDLFGLHINFYGIISALGYLLAVVLAIVFAKKRGFKTEDILTLALYVIPLAIVGARLGFVLFKLENYHNFWDIFKIWEGGLMFYGGLVGGVIGVVLYCLIHKKNFLALADVLVPALLFGQALGRWGNFFNQEAYGTPVTNPAWQWFPFAVYIDHCVMADCTCAGSGWHLATFFYESMWNLLCFAVLVALLYKANFKQVGCIGTLYLALYGTGRIFIEGLRTDSLYLGSVRVSQLISGIFIVAGTAAFAYLVWKDHKLKKAAKQSPAQPKENVKNEKLESGKLENMENKNLESGKLENEKLESENNTKSFNKNEIDKKLIDKNEFDKNEFDAKETGKKEIIENENPKK